MGDDLDVNAGLEKCFNDLKNKIASGKDERSDKPEDNKQNDKKEDEDDSNTDAVEVNNDSDEDDVMAVDDEPTDHDKALDELEQIEKKTKTILDDEGESNKRPPSSDLSEPVTKKAKTNDESESSEPYDKKKLKKI